MPRTGETMWISKMVITVTKVSPLIVAPGVDMRLGKQRLVQPLPTRTIRTKQRLRGDSKGLGRQDTPKRRFLAEGKEPFCAACEG